MGKRKPVDYPGLYVLLLLVAMGLLHVWLPVAQILPPPFQWAGLVPIVAGAWMVAWAGSTFAAHKTTPMPFNRPSAMVVRGPYRFTRNPMYLGVTIALAGAAMLWGTLTPWLPVALFALIMNFRIIPREERVLSETFGESYDAYRREVRRWL